MNENLILSTVHNLGYDEIATFLDSLRKTGSKAKVHFFVSGVSAGSLKKIQDAGVTVHPFHYLSFRRRQPLLVLWPLWKRMLASRDFPGKCRLGKRIFHLMGLRFIFYYEFLQSRRGQYRNVLLTDCRDVYLQRDPFSENLGPGIHCFSEARTQMIGTCPANRRMVLNAFGPEVLAEIATAPVSCAGTTFGDEEGILNYLRAMIESLCLGLKMTNSNDQGVHNVLIHRHLLPSVHLHDNYSSSVFTAGCEKASDIILNDRDEVVRPDGAVYPVLHQLDRHGQIYRKLLAKLEVSAQKN